MKLNKFLNETKEKYVVSKKNIKRGYWKVIDNNTGETIESGFSTKSGAQFAANQLNKQLKESDMKLNKFLNEEVDKKEIRQKIMDWFKDNPNPQDKDVHGFAEKEGIEPDMFEQEIYGILSSFASNGRFNEKNLSEDDFDENEIKMGIKVESEHTDCPIMAKRIAMDHLSEIKNYYTLLKKMEEDAGIKD